MTNYRKHDSTASDQALRDVVFKDIDLDGKVVLNLGCGNEYVDGWINLDGDSRVKADIHFDLEDRYLSDFIACKPHYPDKYDIIYASHILEHVSNLVQLKEELTSLLKPNGILVVIVPNYLSPDAWGDDTHCRAFSKESFLLSFWPGFKDGVIKEIKVEKHFGECVWLIAFMYKGEK